MEGAVLHLVPAVAELPRDAEVVRRAAGYGFRIF
jgi:hypothetical protein